MSKKVKPRKKSKRAPADARNMVNLVKNPVWAAYAKKPINQETQTTVGVAARLSLTAFQAGTAEATDFSELHVTSHTAMVLAERGYGADLTPDFESSLLVMRACRKRANAGLPWSLDVTEGQIIALLLDLHEQQVQLAGQAELARAIVDGYRRIQVGREA